MPCPACHDTGVFYVAILDASGVFQRWAAVVCDCQPVLGVPYPVVTQHERERIRALGDRLRELQ